MKFVLISFNWKELPAIRCMLPITTSDRLLLKNTLCLDFRAFIHFYSSNLVTSSPLSNWSTATYLVIRLVSWYNRHGWLVYIVLTIVAWLGTWLVCVLVLRRVPSVWVSTSRFSVIVAHGTFFLWKAVQFLWSARKSKRQIASNTSLRTESWSEWNKDIRWNTWHTVFM